MPDNRKTSKLEALRGLEESLQSHRLACQLAADPAHPGSFGYVAILRRICWTTLKICCCRATMKRGCIAVAGVLGLIVVLGGVLWLRLSNGPISLDLVTPWLTSAI